MVEMQTNFVFISNVGIEFENKHYDLHSFFSVENILLDMSCGNIRIEFLAESEFLDKVHYVNKLALTFSDISHIELSSLFCSNYSNSLEEIGFKSSGDTDYNWLKSVAQSEPIDHIVFRFSSLEYLRLASRKCFCQVEFFSNKVLE